MIQPVKEKIILGIDPGTTIMGYGVLRIKGTKPEMIAMGIIFSFTGPERREGE